MKKNIFVLLTGLSLCIGTLKAQWIQKASISGARDGAVSWSINGKFYVVGGISKSDLREYDPATNQWTPRAAIPQGPTGFAMGFVINGKGYLCGGVDGAFSYRSSLLEYDPANNQWQTRAPFPAGPIANGFSFSLGNKGYVGCGDDGQFGNADVYEYDPGTNSWNPKLQFNGGYRIFPYSFNIGNRAFIGGGQGLSSSTDYNDLWEYDQPNDSWTPRSTLPGHSRQAAASFASDYKGYVALGQTANANTFTDVFEYDYVNDLWDTLPAFNHGGRAWATGFADSTNVYLCAGWNFTTFYSDLYALSLVPTATITTTGIKNTDYTSNNSQVYPNPSNGIFSIAFRSASEERIVEIHDAFGKFIKRESLVGAKDILHFNGFSEGVYTVSVIDDGVLVDRIKIVVY